MSDPLTDAARAFATARAAKAAYHASILNAHNAGYSVRRIAEAVGVSHQTIYTIVKRGRDA